MITNLYDAPFDQQMCLGTQNSRYNSIIDCGETIIAPLSNHLNRQLTRRIQPSDAQTDIPSTYFAGIHIRPQAIRGVHCLLHL